MAADFKRVNYQRMMEYLKSLTTHDKDGNRVLGTVSIKGLANHLGLSSPWQLEEDLKAGETGFRAMASIGNIENVPFTVFPARERARYGFPDVVPEVKEENPATRKRAKRNADAKAQKQYWPCIALGDIVPDPTVGTETAYDGRYDDDIDTLRQLLDDNGFEYLEVKGRMVRGGSGIYISMARDADTKSDDSGEVDVSGVVTTPVAA